ncbi:MAG TPA: retropepsin-like aspartic protease [Candidatus Tumulicola sp.]|nr:retropepsin-like aspartic protease [Candidatus Tumulicola sp.]
MAFAARIAMLCALGLATLGAARPSAGFETLLDRMRAASGPVWNVHFVSISRLNLEGQSTVVSTESQGLPFAVRRCTGEICEGTYFDGSRLYAVNMNGTTLLRSPDPEPYLRSLRLIASLGFLAPSFSAHGGRLIDGGDVSFDGKRYRTMYMTDSQALPLRLYVDPATALVRYARDLGGDDTFEYLDYRRKDGFDLPYEIRHNGADLERYDDRTPVLSAFHPPHGPVPAFAGAPQTISTDPAHVTPIVQCTIGGVAVRCLIDSGNSGLSMSSELAARLGANVLGSFRVRGLGDYSTQVVRAGPLKVGNATFNDAYYVVLNDISRYGYDAVLGADFLGSTGLAIDARAHTVRLGAAVPANAIAIPLSFENFVPVVDVHLGSVDTQLAVDTGDESNINLAYDFYSKHSSLFAVTEHRLVSGIGGTSIELIGSIPQVTIGAYRTGPQRIGTTRTLQGTAYGHLGAAFLQQFDVQFDYAAAELHLIPNP